MKRNYTIVILILITFFVISFLTNILGALNPNVSESYQLTDTMSGFLPFLLLMASFRFLQDCCLKSGVKRR